jgi:hypothetical protein
MIKAITKNKKKFDLVSLIIVVATLVILGVGALFIGNIMGGEDGIGAGLQEIADEQGTENANVSINFLANDAQQFSDNYFFWFLIATFIGVLIMGLYLEFEPTTMILIFIIGSIVVGAAWIGGSIYSGFQEEVDGSSGMTKTNVLLNPVYFPVFILVCLILLIIIMYNRKNPGGYQ